MLFIHDYQSDMHFTFTKPSCIVQWSPSQIQYKELTKKESVAERSTRRKQATQREKRRMEKLNHCIEDIKQIVCPDMKVSFHYYIHSLVILSV